jgi:uncharacterized protein YciI
MPQFVYQFKPKREQFVQTMTAEEREVMGRHTQYLARLHAEGTLILAGPCLDGAFALNVFAADSPEAAARILEEDPAVRGGLVHAELHPFHVSFLKGEAPAALNV